MNGGTLTTLANVCESVRYGYTASAISEPYGPLFLRITDIVPESLDWESVPYCLIEDDDRKRFTLAVGDIVVARTGATVGYAKLIRDAVDAVFASYLVRFRVDPKLADPAYVGRLVESQVYKSFVQSRIGGAAQPNASAPVLGAFEFALPSRQSQQRIADILSAYDDLIENNRRRMALLEDTARQLYREWFVRLRFPGHEHTRITNGVPEGWERKAIEQLACYLNRGIAPHYDDEAEGLVINQKCIRAGRLDLSLARRQSREYTPKRQIQHGDILVNSTGEGTLGRVAQVLAPIENCTVDTHVTIVRPAAGVGIHYIGQALMEWEPRLSTMGRGATNQTELSRRQIGDVQILVPQRLLLQQFEDFAAPSFRQAWVLMEQNAKLRAARDLLLPRLMSGEIAV